MREHPLRTIDDLIYINIYNMPWDNLIMPVNFQYDIPTTLLWLGTHIVGEEYDILLYVKSWIWEDTKQNLRGQEKKMWWSVCSAVITIYQIPCKNI